MRPGILSIACALFALAPGGAGAVEPPDVTVRIGSAVVRVSTGAASADVRRNRFRLRLRADGRTLVREQRAGLFYERGATRMDLGRVESVTPSSNGVQLRVASSEGLPATVTLRFLTRRTLEVTLDPSDAASVTAVGERLRSPKRERIYGLTERLRDSPPFIPGVVDQPVDVPLDAIAVFVRDGAVEPGPSPADPGTGR